MCRRGPAHPRTLSLAGPEAWATLVLILFLKWSRLTRFSEESVGRGVKGFTMVFGRVYTLTQIGASLGTAQHGSACFFSERALTLCPP